MVSSPNAMAQGFPVPPITAEKRERLFFGGMVLLLLLVVFAGFAPSYFLHRSFGSPVPLTPTLHLHGLVFTSWMLLLITQTSLIARHRVQWHRRLGMAGVGLAALLVAVGTYTAIAGARDDLLNAEPGISPLVFMAIPLGAMVTFPLLFGAAVYFRRRPDIHKRLILIATMELSTAAVARLPVIATMGPPAFFAATDLMLLPMIIYDLVTLKRVHPATIIGGIVMIAVQAVRLMLSETAGWASFATWLISLLGGIPA